MRYTYIPLSVAIQMYNSGVAFNNNGCHIQPSVSEITRMLLSILPRCVRHVLLAIPFCFVPNVFDITFSLYASYLNVVFSRTLFQKLSSRVHHTKEHQLPSLADQWPIT